MLIQLLAFGAVLLCAYLSFNGKRSLDDGAAVAGPGLPLGRGDEGEKRVSADLHRHLARLCGDDWCLLDGVILIHAPGSAFPTAEIDHLVARQSG